MAWALLVFGLAVRAFAGGLLPPPAGASISEHMIDVNCAGVAELQALPGIGPTRADAIVLERIRAGPFTCLDDLQRVHGIGPDLIRRLSAHVTFANLSMASRWR